MTNVEIDLELTGIIATHDVPPGFASWRSYVLGRGHDIVQALRAAPAAGHAHDVAPADTNAPLIVAPATAPPFSANPKRGAEGYYWWAWHPCYPYWSQSCWGAPTLEEAQGLWYNKLFSRDYSHWKLVHKVGDKFIDLLDRPAPAEHVAGWQAALDFKNGSAASAAGIGVKNFAQPICELENFAGLYSEDGHHEEAANFFAAANCLRAATPSLVTSGGGAAKNAAKWVPEIEERDVVGIRKGLYPNKDYQSGWDVQRVIYNGSFWQHADFAKPVEVKVQFVLVEAGMPDFPTAPKSSAA